MDVLDGFAGAEQLELRERYREAHRECLRLAAELAELRERDGSRERDLDLYRYELSEIEEVAPDPAEQAELATERERLRHAEGLREAAAGAHAGAPPAPTRTAAARRAPSPRPSRSCRRSPASTPGLDALAERLAALAVELGDVAAELRDYAEGVEADPARLVAVEERLDALDRLRRKHGGSVESVLAHAERCREEIERLEGAEERGAEAEAALAEAEARRGKLGRASSAPGAPRPPARWRRGSRRSSSSWRCRARRSRSCSSPTPTASAPAARESVELRMAPNPGSRRRRCATPPPAASSRG